MSDLFDTFTGSAGALLSHTADSGDSWGPTGATAAAIDGAGSAYSTSGGVTVYSTTWTPPGTDYAVAMTVGAAVSGDVTAGYNLQVGVLARCSGAEGSINGYQLTLQPSYPLLQMNQVIAGFGTQLGSNITVTISPNDVFELTVQGAGATVTLTAYQNGTQIGQVTDSTSGRITSAGTAGLSLAQYSGPTATDVMRTIWAGALTHTPAPAYHLPAHQHRGRPRIHYRTRSKYDT